MRKHLIALLGFLSGVMVYHMKAPAPVAVTDHEEEVSVSQSAPFITREPTSTARTIPVTSPPADNSKEELQDVPGLPRGMKFAPHVKAIGVEDYRPAMGKQIMEKNGFVFFHPENGSGGTANVVYDKRLDTFHPLTATIKLSDIDEAERAEILKSWTEFHYNADLAVEYIQSNHEDLFSDYEALAKSGYKAGLEVIQAVYQSR